MTGEVSREQLIRYADVVCMSQSGSDTAEIAARFDLPESLAAAWVANFRELDSSYAMAS